MRNIGIFISSTFTDMQYERDYIKKIIIPQLQNHFSNEDINIYAIDLRWGVDTASVDFDEAREAKVLEVCFDTIQNSRPYFVGLLGNRYGWIPAKEQYDKVYSLFSEDDDFMREYAERRSVTELEMIYGALGRKELIPHSYFFFRSDSVYEQMPDDIRIKYEDSDPEKRCKLQQLKDRIYAAFGQDNRENHIFDYTPKYDRTTGTVTDLEEFGQKFIKAFIEDISKECKENKSDSIHNYNDLYFIKKAAACCGRKNIVSELLDFIKGFNHRTSNPVNGCILCGISGCGKTTVISKVYSDLVNSNTDSKYLILTHIAGSTPESLSYWDMIEKWNRELEQRLNLSYEEKDIVLYFEKLLMYAVVNGYKPVVFIDTYDKLQKEDLSFGRYIMGAVDQYKLFSSLAFIPRFIPFICTSIKESLDDDILDNQYFKIYDMEGFSRDDACEMIRYFLKGKELSQKALTLLLSKSRSDGTPSYSHPIWVKTAMTLLEEMGNMEFSEISQDDTVREDRKIDDYICKFIENFSAGPDALFRQFVSLGMGYFSRDIIKTVTNLLAISKFGVSEYDFEQYLGDKWNPLDFSYIIRWLSPFVEKDTITNSWRLTHDILKHSIEKNSDIVVIERFKRKYVLSLLPSSCYSWRTLKECFSIIMSLGDVCLFREAIFVFDFLYNSNSNYELRNQVIISDIIRQVGTERLASVMAESVRIYMDDKGYLSDLLSFTLRMGEEHEFSGISDDDYSDFYHKLYNCTDIQVRIDCDSYGFNNILSDIYSECVVRDGIPVADRYSLYAEYIKIVREKYRKYGPASHCDTRLFYRFIYDYVTLRIHLSEFAGFNEEEREECCSVMRQRLAEIEKETDWLVLLNAVTPEDVIDNGDLLCSVLSPIYEEYRWLSTWVQEDNMPTEVIPEICRRIKEKCSSAMNHFDGITDANVQFTIGYFCYTRKLYPDSYNWFAKAAEQNNADAEYYIAEMYYDGKGVEQNTDHAVEWYMKSARHGNRFAQNILGLLYENGIGVPKDYEQARKWYLLSAGQGFYRAMESMGYVCMGNLGAGADYKQAFEWFFKAALRHSSYSQYFLGVMFMEGIGIEKDKDKALFWLHHAKKADEKMAIEYLEQYESGQPDSSGNNEEIRTENIPEGQYTLIKAIRSLKYAKESWVSFPDNSKDFMAFSDYMILHFINYENLGVRYNSDCRVSWPSRRLAGYNMHFAEEILEQMKYLYVLSRKYRAFIHDDDPVRVYEYKLLSYFLKNNQRENARRLVFEKFELMFRDISVLDPLTVFRLFVINNNLHDSEEEVVAVYEMLQEMDCIREYNKEVVAKESEGLVVCGKTESEISMTVTDKSETRYGYCDVEGNTVLPFEYEYASFFYDGEALVSKNGQWYYISHSGEKIRDFYGLSCGADITGDECGGPAFRQRVRQIRSVIEKGPADEQYRIAEILDSKLSMWKEAAPIFESAAMAGHPKSQLAAGFMYYKGRGVECNIGKAIFWFKKGAEQGEKMCGYWLKEIEDKNIGNGL